ncbi:transcriptional repressor [bacterium]|nr:transcriptional repressor [bacterium]
MIINNIAQLLETKNIQASYHRIKILEYLVNNRIHPTVDNIYSALVKGIPTLSKTTVYNTVKLFVSKKLVMQVTVEDNEARYDYSETPHFHFKCKKCEKLYDIFQESDLLKSNEIDGHRIEEYHIDFKGICSFCTTKGEMANG